MTDLFILLNQTHMILNSQNYSPIIKTTTINYIFNLTFKYSYYFKFISYF